MPTPAPYRYPETSVPRRAKAPDVAATTPATPVVNLDGPPAVKLPSKPASDEATGDGPEPWVLSIMADPGLGMMTKLRAAAMGMGLIESNIKSEDEFFKNLTDPNNPDNIMPASSEPGLTSDEAARLLRDVFIRNRAMDKVNDLMGADWHAPVGSEAWKKAQSLHRGNPQDERDKALMLGMVWVYEHREQIETVQATALQRYKDKKSPKARETLEAASELLTAVEVSTGKVRDDLQYSQGDSEFAKEAWRYLGSEKSKKFLEKMGAPIPWFTTCVTMVDPVAKAAGVDTSKWGALEMFQKKTLARFKASEAWVPAEKKEQPQPGDILIFVTYLSTYSQEEKKNVTRKELGSAVFQHVGILVQKVTTNEDGTETWVTADGGKGSAHHGQDKTGLTTRRYNPQTQQFLKPEQTNIQEAAEGGRYLLGFWSLPRLPMVKPEEKDKPKKK
jgi:hypothetical protein